MRSDEWLIRRMLKGDEAAIDEFVKKYYPMILIYCRKRLADNSMAEDMTQETFERFFRSLSSYRHYGKISNYLYTIAGNLCKDFYKQNHTELPMDEETMLLKPKNKTPLSYDPIAGIADQMDMKNAMEKLPEIYREIVILHFFRNLKQAEIAAILNLRVHIVKYRIKKGKALLQKILKEGEFYDGK